jgi:hypothetical protein
MDQMSKKLFAISLIAATILASCNSPQESNRFSNFSNWLIPDGIEESKTTGSKNFEELRPKDQLGTNQDKPISCPMSFYRDSNNLYSLVSSETGPEMKSVIVIDTDRISRPKIGEVDAKTAELLRCNILKDKQYVYETACIGCSDPQVMIVPGADPASFSFIGKNYAKDKNYVYVQFIALKAIPGADLESFTPLKNSYYSKDKNGAYFAAQKLWEADPTSFEIIEEDAPYYNYAKDKNWVYFNERVIRDADIGTFKIINSHYSEDRYNYFFNETIDKQKGVPSE